ncbi:MAG: hypothetical protein P1U39_09010 [Legionellaceae bacterium]|nr:hypothetical protein [Legionellaceae bacterium]
MPIKTIDTRKPHLSGGHLPMYRMSYDKKAEQRLDYEITADEEILRGNRQPKGIIIQTYGAIDSAHSKVDQLAKQGYLVCYVHGHKVAEQVAGAGARSTIRDVVYFASLLHGKRTVQSQINRLNPKKIGALHRDAKLLDVRGNSPLPALQIADDVPFIMNGASQGGQLTLDIASNLEPFDCHYKLRTTSGRVIDATFSGQRYDDAFDAFASECPWFRKEEYALHHDGSQEEQIKYSTTGSRSRAQGEGYLRRNLTTMSDAQKAENWQAAVAESTKGMEHLSEKYPLDPMANVGNIRKPVLLLQSQRDDNTPPLFTAQFAKELLDRTNVYVHQHYYGTNQVETTTLHRYPLSGNPGYLNAIDRFVDGFKARQGQPVTRTQADYDMAEQLRLVSSRNKADLSQSWDDLSTSSMDLNLHWLRPGIADDFYRTFGFKEGDFDTTRAALDRMLVRDVHGRPRYFDVPGKGRIDVGTLETPCVTDLREQAMAACAGLTEQQRATLAGHTGGQSTLSLEHGDADKRHRDVRSDGRVFQLASQFNMLEMCAPTTTPADRITMYAYDRTQGPACTRSTYAALAIRHFFAKVAPGGRKLDGCEVGAGQNLEQFNLLADALNLYTKADGLPYVQVVNGYTESTAADLAEFNRWLDDPSHAQQFRDKLRIGIQSNIGVVDQRGLQTHTVSQTFNAALAIGYSRVRPQSLWEPMAKAILQATYEATLLKGVLNNIDRVKRGLPPAPIELTKVGGGVFGNQHAWIKNAIVEATKSVLQYNVSLDLQLVGFGAHEAEYLDLPEILQNLQPLQHIEVEDQAPSWVNVNVNDPTTSATYVRNEDDIEDDIDWNFYLKCLSSIAMVGGGAMLVVGLLLPVPGLAIAGACLLGVGVAIRYSLPHQDAEDERQDERRLLP